MKATHPQIQIVGCLPKNSPAMYECIIAGEIVDAQDLPTLSEGSAGGVEPGAITFGYCQRFVDYWELVSEEEIETAMNLIAQREGLRIEGAAGVAVAAFLKRAKRHCGEKVAVVICGGNV